NSLDHPPGGYSVGANHGHLGHDTICADGSRLEDVVFQAKRVKISIVKRKMTTPILL
ncbi:hypothetical protein HAX54_017308, partial [Datura stramonium]|nr:hypothetical protein [Datura stramonium]